MHGCIVRRLGAVIVFSFFSVLPSAVIAAETPNPIPHFHEVEDGLLRGGTPGKEGVAWLKAHGVKTIVNLDDNDRENLDEATWATAAGIREVALPMSGFWTPSDEVVNAALAALDDPSLRPLFVHCAHGQDRTGLIVGLYRVETEHWQPGHAYQEMRNLGFHPELFLLNRYFEDRTGFHD